MQKLLLRMMTRDKKTVTSAYIAYIRKQNNNTKRGREDFIERGFEEVDTDMGLLPDGRHVFDAFGKRWALNKEAHDLAIKEAMDEEVARAAVDGVSADDVATKSVAGTDGLSEMICPKCGDTLQYSAVCGACAAGKAGYRHRYSCVHGHVDLVSKEKI